MVEGKAENSHVAVVRAITDPLPTPLNNNASPRLAHGLGPILAVIWQQGVGHLPGYISKSMDLKFSDIPDGVAAISAVPALGWAQILWFVGLLELGPYSLDTMGEPGQFKIYNPFGDYAYPGVTEENRTEKLTIELQNGRLAMLGVLGILFGDTLAPGTMGLPTEDGIGLF